MDRRPPRLAVLSDDELPGRGRSPRRGPGWGLPLAVLVGLAAGAAALFFVVKAIRDSGDDEPKAQAPVVQSTSTDDTTLRILFQEGLTREQMAERVTEVDQIANEKRGVDPSITADDYLVASKDTTRIPRGFSTKGGKPRDLEGFLFPATYEFTPATTAAEIVDQQLEAFADNWEKVDLKDARKLKLSAYEVLIIASMVEEEVREPKERALVAAVIVNRLERGMPLGIDATLRYGLDIPNTEAITASQLESDNPYNTRKLKGLPPTPIANPGLAAMQAAAHPAKQDYLYFVRKKDCKTHFFTNSQEKFLAFLDGPNSFRRGPNSCG